MVVIHINIIGIRARADQFALSIEKQLDLLILVINFQPEALISIFQVLVQVINFESWVVAFQISKDGIGQLIGCNVQVLFTGGVQQVVIEDA